MNAASPVWQKSSHSGNEGGQCVEAALVTSAQADPAKPEITE